MSENSKIEWTDHTFNPWIGCTKISPACDHCYAEAWDRRFAVSGHAMRWGAKAPRTRTSASNWALPKRWNNQHEAFYAKHGRRQRVFCASLADVFDNAVDREWRDDLATLILDTPNLDWLLLTKRIVNAGTMLGEMFLDGPPENIWLGATICNQEEADRDIPKLLGVPARMRFLSMEPLLGPVDLTNIRQSLGGESFTEGNVLVHKDTLDRGAPRAAVDWVIVGGESGPGARPMHPDWARDLRDQCNDAGVPFFFKQWGEWLPWLHFSGADVDDSPEQTRFDTREYVGDVWIDVGRPDYWASMDGEIDGEQCAGRVGKKAAGRQLDGRTWDEVPA